MVIFTLKILAAIATLYFVAMIVKELVKIVREKDDYNDSVNLP
jgi:hypothetical protein